MIMKTLRSIFFLSLCLLLSVAGYAGDKASFLKKQFTARDGYQLNYRVLYPRDYNPAQKYPVILFLHGAGERGSDNEAQLVLVVICSLLSRIKRNIRLSS